MTLYEGRRRPCAVIDVGSNTIRILICSQDSHGCLVRSGSFRSVTRLGESLHSTGYIKAVNIARSISTLREYRNRCDRENISDIYAVGTSALREARNSRAVLEAIRKETGIAVEVISGEREADLTLVGIMQGIAQTPPTRALLLLDIGGGSTEWVSVRNGTCQKGSLQIGALRLFEKHIAHDPPSPNEETALRDEITEAIQDGIPPHVHPDRLIITGGTASTLASIDMKMVRYDGERTHLHPLHLSSLKEMHAEFLSLPRSERLKIVGMEQERVDIIMPGSLIVIVLMEVLSLSFALVSDYGLLEGIAAMHFAGSPFDRIISQGTGGECPSTL